MFHAERVSRIFGALPLIFHGALSRHLILRITFPLFSLDLHHLIRETCAKIKFFSRFFLASISKVTSEVKRLTKNSKKATLTTLYLQQLGETSWKNNFDNNCLFKFQKCDRDYVSSKNLNVSSKNLNVNQGNKNREPKSDLSESN